MRVTSRLAHDRLADVAIEIEETVNAIHRVQAFGRERHMHDKFDYALKDSLDTGLARVKLRGVLSVILIFLVYNWISVIFWIGGLDLMADRISPGYFAKSLFVTAS